MVCVTSHSFCFVVWRFLLVTCKIFMSNLILTLSLFTKQIENLTDENDRFLSLCINQQNDVALNFMRQISKKIQRKRNEENWMCALCTSQMSNCLYIKMYKKKKKIVTVEQYPVRMRPKYTCKQSHTTIERVRSLVTHSYICTKREQIIIYNVKWNVI